MMSQSRNPLYACFKNQPPAPKCVTLVVRCAGVLGDVVCAVSVACVLWCSAILGSAPEGTAKACLLGCAAFGTL